MKRSFVQFTTASFFHVFRAEFTGNPDPITAQYFSGKDVRIHGHTGTDVQVAFNLMFNRQLTEVEIRRLTGAPDRSTIACSYDSDASLMRFVVDNRECYHEPSLRTLKYRIDEDTIELSNQLLRVKRSAVQPGFGPRILAHQVIRARLLEVTHISTRTAGRLDIIEEWAGYYAWPLCGFTKVLSNEDKRLLPQELRHVNSLVELISSPEGRKWWMEYGYSEQLTFFLKEGSESMMQFECYMNEKGIRL